MANRKWQCPTEEHPAVKAPEKGMRRDDVRRFCLACSEATGRLVVRVCPVAERVQERKAERRKAKAKKRVKKTGQSRQAKLGSKSEHLRRRRAAMRARVQAVDSTTGPDYLLSGIDLQQQLNDLLVLPSVPRALRVLKPKLHLRYCEKEPTKWGFADFRDGRGYLSVSLWPGIGPGAMLAHLCHELAHLVAWHECVARNPHGPDWRKAYVTLVQEGYGGLVPPPVGTARWDLDDMVTLHLSEHGRNMMRRAKEQREVG
jgi:hypothetical protein